MVLLHLLAQRPEIYLIVAHIDHGLRTDSGLDRRLVEETADVLGVPFRSLNANLIQASEDKARKVRYEFLEAVRKETDARAIITAHHADDRLETSLFHAWRGAGATGLISLNSSATLLRPLLGVSKNDLLDYARHQGIPWREDSTNTDITLQRNFIRHEIIPHMNTYQPGLQQRFKNLHVRLDQVEYRLKRHLDKWLQNYSRETPDGIELDRSVMRRIHPKVTAAIMVEAIRRVDRSVEFDKTVVNELVKMAKSRLSSTEKPMSSKLKVVLAYDRIFITRVAKYRPLPAQQELGKGEIVEFGAWRLHLTDVPTEHNAIMVPVGRLTVRSALPGDRIAPIGMQGTKKLHDVFIDRKVPKAKRQHWPVVVDEMSNIVLVPGLAISRTIALKPKQKVQYLISEVV